MVFYTVNVLLLPITLIGYVIWLARIYMARRASGASITAQGPLRHARSCTRWASDVTRRPTDS
jgi:hypothetical protein